MEKIAFTNPFYLKLQLVPPHFSRTYGVMINFTDHSDEVTSLKYEVMVSYVKTIADDTRLFRIERLTPVYINDVVPLSIIDQLAHEAGKVFYPLVVEAGFDGRYKAVHNHQEIMGRWPAVSEKIRSYFTGEETEKYLQSMEDVIRDGSALNVLFGRDLFINTYFAAIYKSYTSSYEVEECMLFPLPGNAAALRFSVLQRVDIHPNSYGAIEIQHEGTANDERSAEDLRQELEFPLSRMENPELESVNGKYNAKYILDPHTRSAELVVASWSLPDLSLSTTEIRLFRIDTEAIESSEEATNSSHTGKNLVYIDGGHQKSKTTWSGLLESVFGIKTS